MALLSPFGLYLHVPFCASACDFCAFYQEAPRRSDIDRYLQGIAQEAAAIEFPATDCTVFWGGGTPGLLPAADLDFLARTLRQHLKLSPLEWSVEMAPSTVKADKLQALVQQGVNRISLGVQSFDPPTLERLGRRHSVKQVEQAIETLKTAGINNWNLDLIFAIPGQSLADWERDLRAAIAHAPQHISTYCLTFEKDTQLWVKLQQGQTHKQSEEEEAAFYEHAQTILEDAGYAQYEVSNFARPGFACEHNLNTWRMGQWIGLGPSASSQWADRRWTHAHSIDEWLRGVETNIPARIDEVTLTDAILATDSLIFGLRMNQGVDLCALQARFPQADWLVLDPFWQQCRAEDLLLRESSKLKLTAQGRLLADRIGTEILQRMEAADLPALASSPK